MKVVRQAWCVIITPFWEAGCAEPFREESQSLYVVCAQYDVCYCVCVVCGMCSVWCVLWCVPSIVCAQCGMCSSVVCEV